MENLHIVIIVGTARKLRKSIFAARLIEKIGNSIEGVTLQLVDPVEMNIPFEDGNDEDNKIPEWVEINKNADAYFVVTPEYNHGYPGTLKKLLDNDLGNYSHKPVAFAGVSSGPWGGVRVIEALLPVVRELGMVATYKDVNFPKIQEIFDENGKLLQEQYENYIKKSYEELIWMGNVLKKGRINAQLH